MAVWVLSVKGTKSFPFSQSGWMEGYGRKGKQKLRLLFLYSFKSLEVRGEGDLENSAKFGS